MDQKKIDRHAKMIVSLWAKGHETPYEKALVHFLVDTDIASHIHLLKHRISSLNAESARYKELKEDKYYLPEDWINVPVDKKHYNLNYINTQVDANWGSISWIELLDNYTRIGNALYHRALEDLTPVLGRKRAKESARYFKTYNTQIQADAMFNLRSFANLLRLRNSEHAQKEIREIAQQMHDLVENIPSKPFKTAMWVISRANEIWIEKQKEISEQLINEFASEEMI